MKRKSKLALGLAGFLAVAGAGGCAEPKQKLKTGPVWLDNPKVEYISGEKRHREFFTYVDQNGQRQKFRLEESRKPYTEDWHISNVVSSEKMYSVLEERFPNLARVLREDGPGVEIKVRIDEGNEYDWLRFVRGGNVIDSLGIKKDDGTIGVDDIIISY